MHLPISDYLFLHTLDDLSPTTMYQHTFHRLTGAIALSTITLIVSLADSATAGKKPFSFGSSFNARCARSNINFVLTTETSDGRAILDADPSPNSGLFKGAIEQYSFSGEVENSSFFDFSVPCGRITRQIPTLDLITSINGSSVDFRLVSPVPYEERYLEFIIVPPDPSSEDPFPIVNTEERITTRPPGTVASFNLVGLDFFQSDFDPVVALPPTFQKALVNSLDLLDFIEIEAVDALQANILHINLGRDSEAIEQIINHPVDVPEPTTAIALMIAGTLGWVGLKKKQQSSGAPRE
jgi:hypothetical protein